MNEDFELKFKDKEIERVTSELTKSGKRQFGESLKNAFGGARSNIELGPDETAPAIETMPEVPEVPVASAEPAKPNDIAETSEKNPEPPAIFVQSEDEAKKELYSIVKPLRTYERDIAETIREKNESVTSINLAEQKKREDERNEPGAQETAQEIHRVTEKGLVFLVSVVLIIAGIGIVGFIISFIANRPPAPVSTEPALISTDERRTVGIDVNNPAAAFLLIQQELRKPAEPNQLVSIQITETATSSKISAEKFFTLFATGAPASLMRALGTEWIFGFHSLKSNDDFINELVNEPANESTNELFIFATVASFDNTFDGMLRWEADMAEDFGTLTAMSTPGAASNTFEDVIIRNKDTRVLKNSLGNIILIYSFLDTESLVITTNEQTFGEVLNRFFSSQVVL